MHKNSCLKPYKGVFCLVIILLLSPATAHAYIGPGAGVAVVGSFFVMFVAILSAVSVLLTWPIRYAIRAFKGPEHLAHAAKVHGIPFFPGKTDSEDVIDYLVDFLAAALESK